MALSKVQIYNITLNLLGVSSPLENTNSDDNKVILLNNYYDLARDYVLKDFDWNFASTFKKLARLENSDCSKYKHCFNYPNDCVCARDIFEQDNYIQQKFEVSSLPDCTTVIYTDVEKPILRYTKRIDKEIYFSCEFSMALAYYLASLTANVVVGSTQKAEIAWEKYLKILKHARVLNAYECGENIYDEKTYLDSRG